MDTPGGIEASQSSRNVFGFEVSSEKVHLIDEGDLKKLARGRLKDVIQSSSPGNNEQLFRLWKCLLHMSTVSDLSAGHRTAVCNATSAFLNFCPSSPDEELRALSLSSETWFSVFDPLVDHYDDARHKPTRQLLLTLVRLLIDHPDKQVFHSIRARVVCSAVQTIVLFHPRSHVKASLHVLELFMQKGVVTVRDVVEMGEEWLWARHDSWVPSFREHCAKLNIPINSLVREETRSSFSTDDVRAYAAQIICLALLFNAQNHDRSLTSGALFSLLCCNLAIEQPNVDTSVPFWVEPLRYVSLRSLDVMDIFYANHVLYHLFQSDPSHFRIFLDSLPLKRIQSGLGLGASDSEMSLLFATLEAGKELGLIQKDSMPTDSRQSAVPLDASIFRPLLIHTDPDIRLSTLSLLVVDPSTTRPIPPSTLSLLQESLPYMHAEIDSHSRGELFSLLRKLVVRLRGASSRTQEDGSPTTKDERSSLSSHAKGFLIWYIGFLEGELHPCASYQTHIMALKVLLLLLESGLDARVDQVHLSRLGLDPQHWRFNLEIFGPSLFRAAGDLLADAFDDVRASAATILRIFPPGIMGSTAKKVLGGADPERPLFSELITALSRAEDMAARSGRADYADTVARLHHILFGFAAMGSSENTGQSWYCSKYSIVNTLLEKLEGNITSCDDPLRALRNTPLHGHISALRYIVGTPNFYALLPSSVSSWRSVHERIVSLCERVWEVVRPVLCVDSPETEQDTSAEEVAGPKDILSCSWRALRESSLLLHEILLNETYAPLENGPDGLNREDFKRIGALSFTQLAELRHRGAFSNVAQTFAACLKRCSNSKDPTISSLSEMWYKDTLMIIHEQASKFTRRSAGLPSLITGIACSSLGTPLFEKIVSDLQDIAKSETLPSSDGSAELLPQVHALNCLKDMATHNTLGPSIEHHLTPCLHIAADSLGSRTWAIRNCGLMLFRALMTRMNRRTTGTRVSANDSSSRTTGHANISFEKYPALLPLLSRLLQTPAPKPTAEPASVSSSSWDLSMSTEHVFPALELIGNKNASSASNDDPELRRLVFGHTGNPVWGIRDHAARVYASLVSRSSVLSATRELADEGHLALSENQAHGRVLCVRYLLQELWSSPSGYWKDSFDDAGSAISQVLHGLGGLASSPMAKAALVEVLNDAIEAAVGCGEEETLLSHLMVHLARFQSRLDSLLENHTLKLPAPRSSSLLMGALGLLVLSTHVVRNTSTPEALFSHLETISQVDHDAGPWILGRLQRLLTSHEPSFNLRLQMYGRIILDTESRQLQQVAVFALANELEFIQEKGLTAPDTLHGLLASLYDTIEKAFCDLAGRREFVNAVLHLRGCILPLSLESGQDLNSSDVRLDLNKLISSMTSAMRDETEFPTRYSAVLSMKCLLAGLWKRNIKFHETPALINAYLLLYDMLNDDDEELRDLAAKITAKVLTPDHAALRVPRAASIQLTRFLRENFADSPLLFEGALRRFLGRTHGKTIFVPVANVYAKAKQEAAMLFAEEKQNLYIDDLQEAKTWGDVLEHLVYPNTSTSRVVNDFCSWVSDGLETLIEAVRDAEAQEGVLGWSSQPDIFIAGSRVICGAQVLLRTRGLGHAGFDALATSGKLEDILEHGGKEHLSGHWITGVISALEFRPLQRPST